MGTSNRFSPMTFARESDHATETKGRTILSNWCTGVLLRMPFDRSSTCYETWNLYVVYKKYKIVFFFFFIWIKIFLENNKATVCCDCLPSLYVLAPSLCPTWTMNMFMLESINAKYRLSGLLVVISWTSVTGNPCFIAGNAFNGTVSKTWIAKSEPIWSR